MELPHLDDVTLICIKRFIAEIEDSEFHSRQFNIVLPEILAEALRIDREAHHDE